MEVSRRSIVIGLGAVALGAAGVATALRWKGDKGVTSDLPDPKQFQSGDFVWPKKKGVIVPYSGAPASSDQRLWEAQRDAFLNSASSNASPEVIELVRKMSYSKFEDVYYQSGSLDSQPTARSAGSLSESVGHVGILEVDGGGRASVIEATPIEGSPTGAVIRLSYQDWIKDYTEHQVWHGRIDNVSADERRKIAAVAKEQIGKPYDFFNFNLDDDSRFYCSKLAWLATFRALKVAPDGNPNPDRGRQIPPWFSPKQLANAKTVTMLHKPGKY